MVTPIKKTHKIDSILFKDSTSLRKNIYASEYFGVQPLESVSIAYIQIQFTYYI